MRDGDQGRSTQPLRVAPSGRGRVLPRVRVGLVAVAAIALAACSTTSTDPAPSDASGAPADAGTTATASVVAPPASQAAPGTVIEARPIDAPAGTRVQAFTYHSTSASGADIAVSGLFLAPDRPPPTGGFPVITWGHPTTGAADGCEPSRLGVSSLPFPDELADRGWAVVATDYEGLGAAGAHPYLVGDSEGHAMLDAARAASQLPGSGVEAGSPVVIWGFSQGGHAAAFAAQLAPTYAPELDVRGVAIASPVSDVTAFTQRAEAMDDQLGVVLTTVNGYAAAYPELDPTAVLTPLGTELLGEVEHRCIGEINEAATRPVPDVLATHPTQDRAFAARFAQNRAGDAPVTVPALVVQGGADDIVDPALTAAFVDRWCSLGASVQEVVRPGIDHAIMATDPFVDWIGERFSDLPARSTC
jgi:alpha-beta hydrolase superfamily lysophospholipase